MCSLGLYLNWPFLMVRILKTSHFQASNLNGSHDNAGQYFASESNASIPYSVHACASHSNAFCFNASHFYDSLC